jgi:hypothetical protein
VQAQKRVADLEAAAVRTERRLARGTGDVQEAVAAQPVKQPALVVDDEPATDLATDLEATLRAAPMSASDVAQLLGVPVAHVTIALRSLRKAGRVYNVGTSDQPLWSWIIGESASTTDLMVEVEKLLKLPRAWSLQELVAATGCGHNRISGVRVRLMKAGLPVRNLGNNWRGRWTANPKLR